MQEIFFGSVLPGNPYPSEASKRDCLLSDKMQPDYLRCIVFIEVAMEKARTRVNHHTPREKTLHLIVMMYPRHYEISHGQHPMNKTEQSWILYDWANSAYSLAITTAILPIYFKDIAASGVPSYLSTAWWGYTNTAATLTVALLAPLLGTLGITLAEKKDS